MAGSPCDIRGLAGSPILCGAVVFRHRGQLRVTAVVKATFSLVEGATMTLAPPSELLVKDRFFNRNPSGSLEAASDLVPYRPRVDVTFVGRAYAPGGSAAVGAARLAVFRDGALVDKSIHVYGDRAQGGAPGPFDRMPIVYERAYAMLDEPSMQENPVGVAQPNIVDPRAPTRPIGFGPISRYWPGRKRLLGGMDARGLDALIADIPDAFDWSYFQVAPPDQQIDALRGDEWIVLDGLHPTAPRLASRLPSAVAVARAYRQAGAGQSEPLALLPDSIAIDGDRQVCDVVWRGSLPVSGEAALSSLQILAALELPGQPVVWPPRVPEARPAARLAAGRGARAASLDGATLADPGDPSPARAATPFDGKPAATAAASLYAKAGAQVVRAPEAWTGTLATPDDLPESATPFDGTLAILDDLDAPRAHIATPFERQPASPANASPYAMPAGPVVRAPQEWTGTLVAADDLPAVPPSVPASSAPAVRSFQAPSPPQAPALLALPAGVEERREMVGPLARADATGEDAATAAHAGSVGNDDRLVEPPVVPAAELPPLQRYAEVLAHVMHFPPESQDEVVKRLGFDPAVWRAHHDAWTMKLIAGTGERITPQWRTFGETLAQTKKRLQAEAPPLSAIGSLPPASEP